MKEIILDIEERKKIWIALSDLFLDTDVTLNYEHIAVTCSKSPYSIPEIKTILDTEVAPTCAFNLKSVAGEWAGFNEEWLINSISKRIQKKRNIFNSLFNLVKIKCISLYTHKHWLNVSKRIIELRNMT